MSEEEIYQPFIGVATTWNESAPCNITLGRQAQAPLAVPPSKGQIQMLRHHMMPEGSPQC